MPEWPALWPSIPFQLSSISALLKGASYCNRQLGGLTLCRLFGSKPHQHQNQMHLFARQTHSPGMGSVTLDWHTVRLLTSGTLLHTPGSTQLC